MATKQFGVGYDAAAALDGTETLSIVQGGVTVDATTQDIADLAPGFANPMTTAGDIIKGGASGAPERLAVGTNGYVLTVSAGAPVWAANTAGISDGDKGDITVTASGATWTIDNGVVSNAKLADVATATFKGRTTAGTGVPEDLTATQATALLNTFDSSNKGLAPASGGGTSNYLRADGTWAAPSAGSSDPFAPFGSNFTTGNAMPTNGGVTVSNMFGVTIQNSATFFGPTGTADTRAKMPFVRFTGASATNSIGGGYTTVTYFAKDNGYKVVILGGPESGISANHRMFMGLRSATGATTDVDPSSLTNIIALAYDTADSNLQLMHNDGSGTATKVDLGASFAKSTSTGTQLYRLTLECTAGGNITWTVDRLHATTATATGTITTDQPSATTLLGPAFNLSAGGLSVSAAFAFFGLYWKVPL